MLQIKPDVTRIEREIIKFSEFADPEQEGFTRLSFSEQYRNATAYLAQLMVRAAGLSVSRDTAGNLIGRREGKSIDAPAIMVGSHLDTVPNGGRFDGVAGIVAGLEIATVLEEMQMALKHPFEVVAFLAEEPSPFGISTVGSRAMTGSLELEVLNSLTDEAGRTLHQAIRYMGGDPDNIDRAGRSPGDLLAYLELHIEQGPFLEAQKIPIGIVTAIVGITRGTIEVIGKNDHAGTTPMESRKDALAAAAEVVLSLEKACRAAPEIVGTVGQMEVFPNASNVIPGTVKLGMELRGLDDRRIAELVRQFEKDLNRIQAARKVTMNHETWLSCPKVILDKELVDLATKACDTLGISYCLLSSGAGHDAGHLAQITPTAMIFVPSKDGRSHCPEEWTDVEHIGRGVELLGGLISEIDQRD
ncbi:MAG: M20 family metallo-hydrolase [Desulfobacterales bacterium]|jgi:hydantoinase/carbamoylase family amidase